MELGGRAAVREDRDRGGGGLWILFCLFCLGGWGSVGEDLVELLLGLCHDAPIQQQRLHVMHPPPHTHARARAFKRRERKKKGTGVRNSVSSSDGNGEEGVAEAAAPPLSGGCWGRCLRQPSRHVREL